MDNKWRLVVVLVQSEKSLRKSWLTMWVWGHDAHLINTSTIVWLVCSSICPLLLEHMDIMDIRISWKSSNPIFFVDRINGVLGTLRHTHIFGQGPLSPLISVFKAFYTLKPRTGATERYNLSWSDWWIKHAKILKGSIFEIGSVRWRQKPKQCLFPCVLLHRGVRCISSPASCNWRIDETDPWIIIGSLFHRSLSLKVACSNAMTLTK